MLYSLGIIPLFHCDIYSALNNHCTTQLYFSIFKYKLLSYGCIPMIIIALKESVLLKRSAARSSYSYGDNTVVTGAHNCEISIENSRREIQGNPSAFLNVFNRLTPRMGLLLCNT